MGIAFGFLSLGGTEPEIYVGVIYPPQLQQTYVKYYCNAPMVKRHGTILNNSHPYIQNENLTTGENEFFSQR